MCMSTKHPQLFLTNWTDLLHLQLVQVLRPPDLAIYASTTTMMTEPITYPLHMCRVMAQVHYNIMP